VRSRGSHGVSSLLALGAACVAFAFACVDTSSLSGGGAGESEAGAEGGPSTSDPDAGDGCKHARGQRMVRRGSYCIDRTEVSHAEYSAFLVDSSFDAGELPTDCSPLVTRPDESGDTNLPVRSVSWCAASAFCKWAGKRLCGRISGGTLPTTDVVDPAVSEWAAVCRTKGSKFPYGDTYVPGACRFNDVSGKPPTPSPVEEPKSCATPDGVVNLAGNVYEWIDSCRARDGGTDFECAAMGGSFFTSGTDTDCTEARFLQRRETTSDWGFRCCADPL
jgi:formylglycine-generating enzyme required for sulfatase activity